MQELYTVLADHLRLYLNNFTCYCTILALILLSTLQRFVQCLGAFAKLRKETFSWVMSVRLSAWKTRLQLDGFFMKFGI